MKKILLITITIFIAFSCKKDEPQMVTPSPIIENMIYAKVFDTDGVDLLDINNSNRIKDIRFFEFKDGVKSEMSGLSGMPYNFKIYEPEAIPESASRHEFYSDLKKDWHILLQLSMSEANAKMGDEMYNAEYDFHYRLGTSRTLVQWGDDNKFDTIKVQYRFYRGGSIDIVEVWVNDELKWNRLNDVKDKPTLVYTKIIK